MDISYTLEVHISLVQCMHAMWMKIPSFNSVKQFLWMVLVKCQHEHYSDLQSLEVKRYHISHNFPEQCKQCQCITSLLAEVSICAGNSKKKKPLPRSDTFSVAHVQELPWQRVIFTT
jgi:hypothetical protein